MIRLAVLDLDGTILHEDKQISDKTLYTLARCRVAGIKVMIASARPLRTLQPYIRQIQPDGVASGNGALVTAEKFERRYPLQHEEAERFLQAMLEDEPSLTCYAEIGNTLYKNSGEPEEGEVVTSEFPRLPQGDIRKLIFPYTGEALYERTLRRIPESMRATVSSGSLIQIQSVKASKWHAVSVLAARWNIAREEIACFGDDWDDVEMIANAGLGVAVCNAIDAAKKAADIIVQSNEEDGPACLLRQLCDELPSKP